MLLWPSVLMFYAMTFLMGMAQALQMVTMAPFLLENSGEEERTYLFSLGSGLQMAAAFLGNSVGGYLPGWIAAQQGVAATSSLAYAGALGIISLLGCFGPDSAVVAENPDYQEVRPAPFLRRLLMRANIPARSRNCWPHAGDFDWRGLFMPFMNVFFRVSHGQPDPVIGNVLAWGALAMGVGLVIAPPLADRYGKVELVVITQGISIPFLIMLGYAPWFWMSAFAHYVRLALMNMSGPVYMTFVMEHVEPDSRATVASLVSMVNSFGWAFSPSISGWLQVNHGFGPVYALVLVLYTVSVYMYWKFFWRPASIPGAVKAESPGYSSGAS
jgi:MFS family permease